MRVRNLPNTTFLEISRPQYIYVSGSPLKILLLEHVTNFLLSKICTYCGRKYVVRVKNNNMFSRQEFNN